MVVDLDARRVVCYRFLSHPFPGTALSVPAPRPAVEALLLTDATVHAYGGGPNSRFVRYRVRWP